MVGIGAAFHGFGLVALGFLVVLIVVYLVLDSEARAVLNLWQAPLEAAAAGVLGWVMWLPVYIIGFGIDVTPGHADESPMRPLFHARYSDYYHRLDQPVFSWHVVGQVAWELWVVSAVLVVLLAWQRGPLVIPVAVAALPVLLFIILFWPVQGLGNDSDFLGAAFPPAFAAAWLVARSARATLAGLLLLVTGQWAFHHILTPAFVDNPSAPPG
jgi:hypothetical protein